MANRTPLLIAIFAVALLVVVFYRFGSSGRERYDWNDSFSRKAYQEDNDQPYGTRVVHRLLENYFPGHPLTDIVKNLAEELPLDETGRSNYLFVGEAMYLDSLSTRRLLDFVAAGNTALLSSKTIPFDLMFHLTARQCEESEWSDYAEEQDTVVRLTLLQPPLPESDSAGFFYARQNQPRTYSWHFIPDYHFCDSLPQRPLGFLNDSLINFARYPFGRGSFLLHTNPVVFSNYSLLKPGSRTYVEGLLSYLTEGPVFWDSYSRIPESAGRRRNNSAYGNRNLPEDHPLSYILQQPPLAWMWYLLLGLAAAYMVFRAKRRQRILPVLPRNENSSYEFISTIAHLHFREGNYRSLCTQNMKLFLAQVRERYNLTVPLDPDTGHPRLDQTLVRRLAQTSEVPEAEILSIFTQYANALNYQPTEQMMVDLHLSIEQFFHRAK
jgi:hypothetical protein